MRRSTRIKPWVRWPAQPPVKYKSSLASRKFDFVPANKQHPAHQGDAKVVARAPDSPVASLGDARRILKETFGHDAFRPEQEAVVSKILSGRNVLIQWPEYSGRSTAYLTAGLAETKGSNRRGLIIVVSRSRPFLEYSASVLGSSGVLTASIHSLVANPTPHEERTSILAAVRGGDLRVLYIHTQQLEGHDIVTAINEAPGGLRLLVIDETQFASPHEYDVGGDLFTKLNDFMGKVRPQKTVILANNHAINDYTDKYIDTGEVFTSHIPWLPQLNLRIRILHDDPDAGYTGIRKVLKSNAVPTLIFVSKDKRQRDFQLHLRGHGFPAKLLTDRTSGSIDWENLDGFSKSRLPLVIGNYALSVVIDKPDLHRIIFTTIPGNIERFDQLCRLAGRDGGASEIVIAFQVKELFGYENRLRAGQCNFATIKALVHEIFHLRRENLPAGLHSLILERRLVNDLDLYEVDLSYVFSLLEFSLGYIKLLFREYAGCRFEVLPGRESFLQTDTTPTGIAIIKHSRRNSESGLFELDIMRAARAEGLSHFVELTAKLNSLQSLGYIKIYPRLPLLIFRLDKIPAPGPETEAVALWLYNQLLRRYESDAQTRHQAQDILLGYSCISAAIANHFGAQLPGGAVRCGRCSFCLDGKSVSGNFTPKEVKLDDIKKVLVAIPERNNPRLLARVAIGAHSPVVRHRDYHLSPVFRSMAECKFEDVLETFARICGVPVEEA